MTVTLTHDPLTASTVDLLQQLIRNACVNDGTDSGGGEIRNARTVIEYLQGSGVDLEILEPLPGRSSAVARIKGTDPTAPSLALIGHTDVVPVEPDGWSRDPFGGELVDDVVWGRGAIDMLNLTAAYAVVARDLLATSWRPAGDLVLGFVADEEHGSRHGVGWLTENHWDLVQADYVLTESGGSRLGHAHEPRVVLSVGEKGGAGRTLTVHGAPGHGSAPYGSRNAAVLAAQAITRIAAYRGPVQVDGLWPQYVDALALSEELTQRLLDPEQLDAALPEIGALAGHAHASTHTTFAPTVVHAGAKINVIPGTATVSVDIRVLPGVTSADVTRYLQEALGDLIEHITVEGSHQFNEPSESPTDTPLFDILSEVTAEGVPGGILLPTLTVGGTDARFYRRKGSVAYGFGLLSDRWNPGTFRKLFHGNDERIDVESLRLTTHALRDTLRRFSG